MSKGVKLLGAAVGVSLLASSSAWAAPIALDSSYTAVDAGLDSRWVNTSFSPHSADQAASAMGLQLGDAGYLSEANTAVDYIDFADGNYSGAAAAGYLSSPLGGDDSFAVEYTGYIDIAAGDTYSFRSFTDDGFRLTIGGHVVSQYFNDRAPGVTIDSVWLDAGIYEFSFLGWEQGGAFVNELTWHNSSTSTWSLVDGTVLYQNVEQQVSAPATALLMGVGLLGMASYRRKKQDA